MARTGSSGGTDDGPPAGGAGAAARGALAQTVSPPPAPGAGGAGTPLFLGLGIAGLLAVWQGLTLFTHDVIVASPAATFGAFLRLLGDGSLVGALVVTVKRLVIALILGTALGLGLGLAAGLRPRLRAILEPARWVATTLPAVVIAVLGMLWFGMGDRPVIFLVFAIVTPIIYVNTLEGVMAVDERLLEMARVYRLPRRMLLTEVYLPGIGASVMAGLTLAAGIGIRAVILAEVLGAFDGIGHAFSRAWTFLNTPEMFAWLLVCLILMGGLEFALLQPLRRRLTHWKERAA